MNATTVGLPKFQHVTIIFPPGREKALRMFYVDVMGFREKPVPEVAKPLGWIWFYTGQEGVELHCVPDQRNVPTDWNPHFCIEVDDLDHYRARLKESGHQIIEARPLPFRPRFFTRDPFNNLIEIVRVEGDYLQAGEM
jgi:catechol 2,3-dioxygenase-like lactoylglutathione lyase family enzyme